MKWKWIMFILSFLNLNAFSQEQSENNSFYEIAPFYNFKQGALSITFDDGNPIQFIKAVPLLNERKIPATFYIITYALKYAAYKKLVYNTYLAHHEIGSHTVNHYNLPSLDSLSIAFELSQSRMDINAVCGKDYCTTFAYPFGNYNDSILQKIKRNYLSARSGQGGYNIMETLNRYELKGWIYTPDICNISHLNSCVEYSSTKRLWLIETFHGIDSIGFNPVKLQDFSDHLDYVKTFESTMWFATVSDVIKYHDESTNVNVVCEECNDTVYKISVTHNLDSIYNLPLSVKLKIPNNWDSVQVSGGEMLKTQYFNGFQYVLFNAKPNSQLVEIRPKIIYLPENNPLVYFNNASPNPFDNFIDINFKVIHLSYIRFELLDLRGNIKFKQSNIYSEGLYCQHFDIQKQLIKGIYFLKMIISDHKNRQYIIQELIHN